MSDNDKTPKPDRAGPDDFDVPAFSPESGGSTRASATEGANRGTGDDLYARTGRAAPQNIPPKQAEPRPFAAPQGAAEDKTTAFPVDDRNSQPLRSDAPTSSFERPAAQPEQPVPTATPDYADSDFAQPQAPQAAGGAALTGATAATVTPPVAEAATTEPVGERREHRRGTMDFGLLLIRLLLGGYLVLAAIATFFQLGDTPGLAALESDYAAYTIPNILAIAVPSMQLAAGVFLLFGLITPVFAALATVVTSFTALHALTDSGAGLNVFAWDPAVILSVVLLVISLALQFTGPGFYSLDFGRKWARRPLVSSWIFVIIGIAGAVALWWFGAGVNPLN